MGSSYQQPLTTGGLPYRRLMLTPAQQRTLGQTPGSRSGSCTSCGSGSAMTAAAIRRTRTSQEGRCPHRVAQGWPRGSSACHGARFTSASIHHRRDCEGRVRRISRRHRLRGQIAEQADDVVDDDDYALAADLAGRTGVARRFRRGIAVRFPATNPAAGGTARQCRCRCARDQAPGQGAAGPAAAPALPVVAALTAPVTATIRPPSPDQSPSSP